MNLYEIEYKDLDPGCPVFRMRLKGYCIDDILDKFFYDDDSGWEILRIAVVRNEKPKHRWNWKTFNPPLRIE